MLMQTGRRNIDQVIIVRNFTIYFWEVINVKGNHPKLLRSKSERRECVLSKTYE